MLVVSVPTRELREALGSIDGAEVIEWNMHDGRHGAESISSFHHIWKILKSFGLWTQLMFS